jgi:hypothetical protein
MWYLSTFPKVLTMGTNSLCSFGPKLMGPINTGTQSTLIHDKTGRIEQGPIVQGPTLAGSCHHSTG